MYTKLAVGLLAFSFVLIGIGGSLDVSGQKRFLGLSKKHFWADGIFMLVLSCWLLLWRMKQNK